MRTRKINQINLNIFANVISFMVSLIISFFVTPKITAQAGIEAYGIIGLANNLTSYAGVITSALNSMASRFIIIELHKGDNEEANAYFNSVICANTAIAIFLMVVSIVIVFNVDVIFNISSHLVTDAKWTFLIVFISFFISLVTSVFGIVYYAKNRLDIGAFRVAESNVVRVALIFALFATLGVRIPFVALATLAAGFYTIIFNIYNTKKMLPVLKINPRNFQMRKVKTLLSAGIWASIGKLSQILLDGLDLLITNIFINGIIMGCVSLSKTLTSILVTLIATVSDAFFPKMLKDKGAGNKTEYIKTIKNSMDYLGAICSLLSALLIVYCEAFYSLWVPEQDAVFLRNLTWLGMGTILFSGAIYSLYSIFNVENKIRANAIALLVTGILSTITVFILLKTTNLGVYAVVGVSSIYGILRNLTFTPIYAAKCLKVRRRTFYAPILRNLLVISVFILISLGINAVVVPKSWILFLLSAGISFVICAALAYGYYKLMDRSLKNDREN